MSSSASYYADRVLSVAASYADLLASLRSLLVLGPSLPTPSSQPAQQRSGSDNTRPAWRRDSLDLRGVDQNAAPIDKAVMPHLNFAERAADPSCMLGTQITATLAAPLYNCTNVFLTAAQFTSRSANTLCTSCAASDAACARDCCAALVSGAYCNCPADAQAQFCQDYTPLTCTPALVSPQLDACESTASSAPAYAPPAACPLFSASQGVTTLQFNVTCAQSVPLKVYMQPAAGGLATDGTYNYAIGDRDKLAYSLGRPLPNPPQFRVKFFNFFRLSDNGQTYYIPLTPTSAALAGNVTLPLAVNLTQLITAAGAMGSDTAGDYPAGGRLYFEGGVWNPKGASFVDTNSSVRYHINFVTPAPQSASAMRWGGAAARGGPLSTGAIVGIVIAALM
ncbi:hypothetical protein HDU90_003967 [Geranomyces variabilis]|nr:hypothetical protein HDU90_003967 [Geranomyces variabilis]